MMIQVLYYLLIDNINYGSLNAWLDVQVRNDFWIKSYSKNHGFPIRTFTM